jgi:hypothetical protein
MMINGAGSGYVSILRLRWAGDDSPEWGWLSPADDVKLWGQSSGECSGLQGDWIE